jgi:hypothetical protein
MAAAVAPIKVSAGAVRFRIGLFHLATTRMTPKNDTMFATKAVATPAAAITMPAIAGPTALARLNSIPFKADAAAKSSLETNSGRMAHQVGFSNASPADRANVNASSNQGEVRPLTVRTARISSDVYHPGFGIQNEFAAIEDISGGARRQCQ